MNTLTNDETGTFVLRPVSHSRYWHMLEILPPAAMRDTGFLVGEPASHRVCRVTCAVRSTYQAFFEADGAQYEAADPITVAEFNAISAADLHAAIQAGSSAPTA